MAEYVVLLLVLGYQAAGLVLMYDNDEIDDEVDNEYRERGLIGAGVRVLVRSLTWPVWYRRHD